MCDVIFFRSLSVRNVGICLTPFLRYYVIHDRTDVKCLTGSPQYYFRQQLLYFIFDILYQMFVFKLARPKTLTGISFILGFAFDGGP